MIEIDRREAGAAIFFRLHHAVADGVGRKRHPRRAHGRRRARVSPCRSPPEKAPGGWAERSFADVSRTAAMPRSRRPGCRARERCRPGALARDVRTPLRCCTSGRIRASSRGISAARANPHFGSSVASAGSPASRSSSSGCARSSRPAGGNIIDVVLTAVAGALGRLARIPPLESVSDAEDAGADQSAPRASQGLGASRRQPHHGHPGPPAARRIADPPERFRRDHQRVEERKAHPAVEFSPLLASVLAGLPRDALPRSSPTGARRLDRPDRDQRPRRSGRARHLAGAEILAAYPFAPVTSALSRQIACYGYRDRLYVGLDTDGTAMTDLGAFQEMLRESFAELALAGGEGRPKPRRRRSGSRATR